MALSDYCSLHKSSHRRCHLRRPAPGRPSRAPWWPGPGWSCVDTGGSIQLGSPHSAQHLAICPCLWQNLDRFKVLAVKRFPLLPDIHAGDEQSGDRSRPGWPHCTLRQSQKGMVYCKEHRERGRGGVGWPRWGALVMAATCSIITVITTISPALDTSSETTVTSTIQQLWNIQIRTPFLCLSLLRVLRTTVEIPEIFWFSPPTGYSPSNVSSHYFYSPRWKTRTIKSFTAHIKQINLMETTVLTLVVMAARRLEALWLILSTHFMTEAD